MTEVVTLAPGPAEFKKALRTFAALDTLGNAVEADEWSVPHGGDDVFVDWHKGWFRCGSVSGNAIALREDAVWEIRRKGASR